VSAWEGKKIVVVGVGGIGGILCARLLRLGADVTPVTGNAAISAALTQHGFRVIELDGTHWRVPTARPPRTELGPDDGPYDLCLAATKITTLAAALADIVPRLLLDAQVVCIQNGLPEEIAASVVGPERAVGCVVGWGGSMIEAGVYQRTSQGGLQLERPGIAADILGHIEETQVTDSFAGTRWSKLAINCATSTLGAIGGARLGPLMRRRFVRRLVLEIWTEVAAVAKASGVRFAPVSGTLDIGRMALTDRERRAALGGPALAWKHSILVGVGMKYRRMRSSMLYAIERGRTPEIDYLNGEIVRRGARYGVATPVNARLVDAVHDIASGRERPSMTFLRTIFGELGAAAARTHAA
jgi:2-dehydropantoate 2-reductase